MLSTRIHGVLDYAVALLLIVLLFLMGLDSGSAETWVLTGAGIAALIYSSLTNYELGLVHLLPMSVHLGLDFLSGLIVAVSPCLFGFADRVFSPHLLMGVFEMGGAAITQRSPQPGHQVVV